MNGADPRARQHRVGSLRDHRQIDRDAIALLDAVLLHDVGEALNAFGKLPVGDALTFIRIVAFPDDGDLIAARREMAIDAVRRNVDRAVLEPANIDRARTERRVLGAGIRLDPLQPLSGFRPEALGVRNRPIVHRLIGFSVYVGPFRPFGGHGINFVGHASVPPDWPSLQPFTRRIMRRGEVVHNMLEGRNWARRPRWSRPKPANRDLMRARQPFA